MQSSIFILKWSKGTISGSSIADPQCGVLHLKGFHA